MQQRQSTTAVEENSKRTSLSRPASGTATQTKRAGKPLLTSQQQERQKLQQQQGQEQTPVDGGQTAMASQQAFQKKAKTTKSDIGGTKTNKNTKTKHPLVYLLNTSNTRYHVIRDAAIRLRLHAQEASGIQGGWAVEDDGRDDVPRFYWKEADCARVPRMIRKTKRQWQDEQQKESKTLGGEQQSTSAGGYPAATRGGGEAGVGNGSKMSAIRRRESVGNVRDDDNDVESWSGSWSSSSSSSSPSVSRDKITKNRNEKGTVRREEQEEKDEATCKISTKSRSFLDFLWSDEQGAPSHSFLPSSATMRLTKHSTLHYAALKAKELQWRRGADEEEEKLVCTSRSTEIKVAGESEGLGMTKAQYAYVLKKHGGAAGYNPEKHCSVFWTDLSVLPKRAGALKAWQRLNHFPDMHLIARKVNLFQRLSRIARTYSYSKQAQPSRAQITPQPFSATTRGLEVFPKNFFDFFPLSWSSRTERKQLEDYVIGLQAAKTPKTFLMKPNAGCQGRGIILTRNPISEMNNYRATMTSATTVANSSRSRGDSSPSSSSSYDPNKDYTVQLYVHKPLLIEGRKFDMRVYVLVLSLNNPMPHIFIHKEGLVRIASQPYQKPTPANYKKSRVHLTNYAVNKKEVQEAFSHQARAGKGDEVADAGGCQERERGSRGGHDEDEAGREEEAESNVKPKGTARVKTDKGNDGKGDGGTHVGNNTDTGTSKVPKIRSALPADDGNGDVGLKRDFKFLERFVNENCQHWVSSFSSSPQLVTADDRKSTSSGLQEQKGTTGSEEPASSLRGGGGDEETADDLNQNNNDNAVSSDDIDAEESDVGDDDGDKKGAEQQRSVRSSHPPSDRPSPSPPPRPGISPFHSLMQKIDKAVTLTILSALPELQQTLGSASVGYLTPQNTLVADGGGVRRASSVGGDAKENDSSSKQGKLVPNAAAISNGNNRVGAQPKMAAPASGINERVTAKPTGAGIGQGGPSSTCRSNGTKANTTNTGNTLNLGNRAPFADGRQCFELLGFDILVTESGKVYVLEVNHSPSLFCDSALDQRVKEKVVADVFTLLQPTLLDAGKSAGGSGGPSARKPRSPPNTAPAAAASSSSFPSSSSTSTSWVSGDERYAKEMVDLYYNTSYDNFCGAAAQQQKPPPPTEKSKKLSTRKSDGVITRSGDDDLEEDEKDVTANEEISDEENVSDDDDDNDNNDEESTSGKGATNNLRRQSSSHRSEGSTIDVISSRKAETVGENQKHTKEDAAMLATKICQEQWNEHKRKLRAKIAKSYAKVSFRQVHPVPNSVSAAEKSRGYLHGAGPFLFHHSQAAATGSDQQFSSCAANAIDVNNLGFTPFDKEHIHTRIDEFENTFGLERTGRGEGEGQQGQRQGQDERMIDKKSDAGVLQSTTTTVFNTSNRNNNTLNFIASSAAADRRAHVLGPFAVYDGFAHALPRDPCYHNEHWGHAYAMWCRSMYDTVMLTLLYSAQQQGAGVGVGGAESTGSGGWRGYKRPYLPCYYSIDVCLADSTRGRNGDENAASLCDDLNCLPPRQLCVPSNSSSAALRSGRGTRKGTVTPRGLPSRTTGAGAGGPPSSKSAGSSATAGQYDVNTKTRSIPTTTTTTTTTTIATTTTTSPTAASSNSRRSQPPTSLPHQRGAAVPAPFPSTSSGSGAVSGSAYAAVVGLTNKYSKNK